MRKITFFGLLASLFLFTGCPQKSTPVVDMGDKSTSAQDADSKITNIESIEKEGVEGSDIENKLSRTIAYLEQNAQAIYFEFDKFEITNDMQPSIEQNAKLFNSQDATSLTVKVEGNCDEWGTDEYNYALGLKRAKSVKDALIAQGINSERITIVSYGESNPTCKEATKSCWDKNRRAEFKILP